MTSCCMVVLSCLLGLTIATLNEDQSKWWIADGGNFERTGYKPETIGIGPVANFQEVWKRSITPISMDLPNTFQPLVYNDRIYFFNGPIDVGAPIDCSELYVIDTATGAVKQHTNFSSLELGCFSITTSFIGYDPVIYSHYRYYFQKTALGTLDMVNLTPTLTGMQKYDFWSSYTLPGVVSKTLSTVFVLEIIEGGTQLYGYALPSGTNKFTVPTLFKYNGLSLYEDKRLFAVGDHVIAEFNAENGEEKWIYDFTGEIPAQSRISPYSIPIIAGDLIVVVDVFKPQGLSEMARLVAFNAKARQIAWTTKGDTCATNLGDVYSPAFDGTYFYMNCLNSIQAYSMKDGAFVRTYECKPGQCATRLISGQPIVTKDFIFVLTSFGRVVAFHKESGLFVDETEPDFKTDRLQNRMAYYNGTIYVALGNQQGNENALFAYRLEAGAPTTSVPKTTTPSLAPPSLSKNVLLILIVTTMITANVLLY